MPDEPYQSLYRRYRPQRFAEIRGQEHVTTALRNAVRGDRVAHAYLFSGPRGTGKTSTARILAKALNCTDLADGEPCCACPSCVAVQAGSSLDVVELDAASNNGVDAMRDLVARAALGSPGRRKVYIVDEVHMLTTGASNALLKTLEEPPGHVVFVLATTDPQKVLPTIRSRTQPFEFHLLDPELLGSLVADVNEQAGLGLRPDDLDRVVRRGNGSARDALSALDQAAAAGTAVDELDAVPAIVEALIAKDAGAALVAVADAAKRGRDPQRLAVEVIEHLRGAFLVTMAPAVAGVLDHQRATLEEQSRRLGNAAMVRAMEVLGEALIDMREALDTRITLEVALVRLCMPAADTSPAAIVERLEALERRLGNVAAAPGAVAPSSPVPPPGRVPAGGAGSGAPRATAPAGAPAGGYRAGGSPAGGSPAGGSPAGGSPPGTRAPSAPARAAVPPGPAPGGPPAEAPSGGRQTIGAIRQRGAATPAPAPPPPTPPPAPVDDVGPAPGLDRDELTRVWGDRIFPAMSPGVRSLYRTGRWSAVDGACATFLLPSRQYRDRAEDKRGEVEAALAAHFGGRVSVQLDVEPPAAQAGSPPPARAGSLPPPAYEGPPPDVPPPGVDDEAMSAEDVAALEVASDPPASVEARVMQAFPGSEEIIG